MKKRNKISEIFNKKFIKALLIGLLLGFLLLSPIFIYNYYTLKEKGITDYYFSNIAGIGETVHGGLQTKPWSYERLQEITINRIKTYLKIDTFALIFGILGMIYSIKTKKAEILFLSGTILILHLYLAGVTGSGSHYIWQPMVLSIFAGYGFYNLSKKIKFKQVSLVLIILALISISFVMQNIIEEREVSITLKLRDYVKENIPNDAIVVIDPRIYTGIHAWVFNDKHYVSGQNFISLANQLEEIKEGKMSAPLYYIECGEGTNCGWKPEDFSIIFETGEELSDLFKRNTKKVAEINAHHNFNIYQGAFSILPEVYDVIDREHLFWFYPTGWKYPELAVDYYEVKGFDNLINGFGFFMLWINVILALLSIPFVFYLSFRKSFKI